MEYLNLEQIKEFELGILKYVDSICTQNNLKYFISFGTLIGAVRHKGFIPWDDDIDISMPREDYNKLMDIMMENPDTRYKIITPETKGYPYVFNKVVDTYTVVEDYYVNKYEPNGLWIDIFPLDGFYKNKKNLIYKFCTILEYARILASYQVCPPKHRKYKLFWWISRIIGYKFFQKRIIAICSRVPYSLGNYVGYAFGVDFSIYKKNFFDSIIRIPFENCMLCAPENYDEYLRRIYGEYMKIPPKNKQINHKIKAYLKNENFCTN